MSNIRTTDCSGKRKNCFNCQYGSEVQYLTEERQLEMYKDLARCDSIERLNDLVEHKGKPILFPQYRKNADNPNCTFWESFNFNQSEISRL